MALDPIASRYAQALFETAKQEGALDEALEQLLLLDQLLSEQPDLRQFLGNPDVDLEDKVGLLHRALKGAWSKLVRAFVHMIVSMGRAQALAEIIEAFRAMVDADAGRIRVLVRSVHPLPDAALDRLRKKLEHREHKSIDVETELAPELLGGLQVMMGHRLIDGSVQRQLSDLRQQLTTVRVC